MRKIFALAILVCLLVCSVSEAARFRYFPADGVCVGDYVRFRDRPGTRSRILGRLMKGDQVTVISQVTVGRELWCEIYDPYDDDRTVWVSGKYIVPLN